MNLEQLKEINRLIYSRNELLRKRENLIKSNALSIEFIQETNVYDEVKDLTQKKTVSCNYLSLQPNDDTYKLLINHFIYNIDKDVEIVEKQLREKNIEF